MNQTLNKDFILGIGHGNQPDPFQRGREAAQMAMNQMPDETPDLVIALGPETEHFQDFIEGVRLVTGEESLLGLPARNALTNEVLYPEGGVVLLLKSNCLQFSVASTDYVGGHPLAGYTSLLTQFRRQRGNTRDQFEHEAVLLLDNTGSEDTAGLHEFSCEAGMDSWFLGIERDATHHMVCNDSMISKGMIAVEILSNSPIGFGSVNLESFGVTGGVPQQAVKAAFREALTHLGGARPGFGMVFFDFPLDGSIQNDLKTIFRESPIDNLPIIGISNRRQSLRQSERAELTSKNSVVAVVIPQ